MERVAGGDEIGSGATIAAQAALHSPVVCRCAGLPIRYLASIQDAASCQSATFEESLESGRRALWALWDDNAFVDCMGTLAPEAMPTYLHRARQAIDSKRTSYYRGLERGLYRFIARFCTRNDTTGAAGSTFWGIFDGGQSSDVHFRPGQKRFATRIVYPSPRHAHTLAHQICNGVLREDSLLVLAHNVRLVGASVLGADSNAFLTVDSSQLALLKQCALAPRPWRAAVTYSSLETVESLVELGALETTLAVPHPPGLNGRLEQVADALRSASVANQEVDDMRSQVNSLLACRRRLQDAEGSVFAQLLLEADTVAGRITAQAIDWSATAQEFLRWLFKDGPVELMPLSLSRRFELSRTGELFDRISGSRMVLPERLFEGLRCSLSDGDPLARVIVERYGADGRSYLWELFKGGILALGDTDPAQIPDEPLDKLSLHFVAEVGRIPLLPPATATVCRFFTRRGTRTDRGSMDNVRIADAVAKLGFEARLRRVDRNFFVSDSARDVDEFSIGGQVYSSMRRDIGSLLKLAGYMTYQREGRTLQLLARLVPIGFSIPLAAAIRALREQRALSSASSPSLPNKLPASDRLASRVDQARFGLGFDNDRRTLVIDDIDYPVAFERWFVDKRFVSTLDLMLMPEGMNGARLILNEAHHAGGGLPETALFPLVQPAERRRQCMPQSHANSIFGRQTLVLPSEVSKQTDGILIQLAGVTVAIESAGRWVDPASVAVPISAFDLHRSAHGFSVVDQQGRAYRLVSNVLCVGDIRLVGATPIDAGEHLLGLIGHQPTKLPHGAQGIPPLRLGDLLVARAAVKVPCGARFLPLRNARGKELLRESQILRAELDLPRWVFITLAGQKPFFCDFESLFALEVMANEVRGYKGMIRFEDMKPGPLDLWLDFGSGVHTAELRFVASTDGADYSGVRHHLAT